MFFDDLCETCPPYNKELLDPLAKYFSYTLLALATIGSIIDLLAIKYRCLAHYFIYLESMIGVLVFFIPTKGLLEMSNFHMLSYSMTLFISFYCGTNIQLIIS